MCGYFLRVLLFMSEKFVDLLEQSLLSTDLRPGALVRAIVVEVRPDRITVNAGLKSDAIISAEEFGSEEIHEGDVIDVVV